MAGRHATGMRKHRARPESTRHRRPAPGSHGSDEIRQRLSREAARLMAEEGVLDFHSAKLKAADRLNLPEAKNLPSNQEIEQALADHLQLFHAQQLPHTLQHLRRLALEAMRFLERFEPRLVGSLLTGHVTRFTVIQLHVTAESPELVGFFLQEQGIPYEQAGKRLRFGGDRSELVPVFSFIAEDAPQGRGSVAGGRMPGAATTVEISVFSVTGAREAPLSPVDGRPMKRAGVKEIAAALETI